MVKGRGGGMFHGRSMINDSGILTYIYVTSLKREYSTITANNPSWKKKRIQ